MGRNPGPSTQGWVEGKAHPPDIHRADEQEGEGMIPFISAMKCDSPIPSKNAHASAHENGVDRLEPARKHGDLFDFHCAGGMKAVVVARTQVD